MLFYRPFRQEEPLRALALVRAWRRCVATALRPRWHGQHSNALADFRDASALAGHCQAGQRALHVPTLAPPASARRRCERLWANGRWQPPGAPRALACAVVAPWAGLTVRWLRAATPKANALRALGIRLAHAHRAWPLATVCYRCGALPQPLPELVRELLEQVLACVPADTAGVLRADRGLAWPTLVDWCQEHGWQDVLRLPGTTHVRCPDGTEQAVRDLAREVGQRWL